MKLSKACMHIRIATDECVHSLQAIADASGYSVQAIGHWRSGRHEPLASSYLDVMEAIEALNKKPPQGSSNKSHKVEYGNNRL